MNKLKKLLLISSALLLSTANNTFALTASATIASSGTVTGTCSISATPMAFGTLSQSAPTTTTSTITATCSNGTSWTVTTAGASHKLYLGGAGNSGSADAITGTVAFLIATANADNFVSGFAGITGSSAGIPQTSVLTGTVAYANVNPVSAGTYGGSVSLTITYL